jgi:hypothetical protein
MDNDYLSQRLRKLLVRIPIVSVSFIWLFWFIWHTIVGSVPKVGLVDSFAGVYFIGHSFSRWWDVPLVGVFAVFGVFAWFLSNKIKQEVDSRNFIVKTVIFLTLPILSAVIIEPFFGFIIALSVSIANVLGLTGGGINLRTGSLVCFWNSFMFSFATGMGGFLRFGGIVGVIFFIFSFVSYAFLSFLIFFAVRGPNFLRHSENKTVHKCLDWLSARDIKKIAE